VVSRPFDRQQRRWQKPTTLIPAGSFYQAGQCNYWRFAKLLTLSERIRRVLARRALMWVRRGVG